jgi:hypothetical protein
MNPQDFWSRLSDTFPFNLLVDAICLVLILWWMILLWWMIREQYKKP